MYSIRLYRFNIFEALRKSVADDNENYAQFLDLTIKINHRFIKNLSVSSCIYCNTCVFKNSNKRREL